MRLYRYHEMTKHGVEHIHRVAQGEASVITTPVAITTPAATTATALHDIHTMVGLTHPAASNRIMLVPVMINGKGPFNLILDTGATGTVITSDLAKEIGIRAGAQTQAHGVTGAVAASKAEVESLAVGDAQVSDQAITIIERSAGLG